jgi:hypothetical protein
MKVLAMELPLAVHRRLEAIQSNNVSKKQLAAQCMLVGLRLHEQAIKQLDHILPNKRIK